MIKKNSDHSVPDYFKGSHWYEEALGTFAGDNRCFCIGDNRIYIHYAYEILSYDVNDVSNVKRKTLINTETMNSLLNKSSRVSSNSFGNLLMNYPQYYNERIYFLFIPDYSNISNNEYPDLWYKLGSCSKDGSDFKIYDNINCTDYFIKDGWIYYYDNGYYYDKSQSFDYSFNKQNAGLYKIKIDGTESQLITKQFQHSQRYNNSCSNLKVLGNYLYFVADTHNINNKLCRVSFDGSGTIQEISRNKAYHYDIVDENTIYYDSQGKLYKISLNNQREDFITELYDDFNSFTVYNNYIYFTNESYRTSSLRKGTEPTEVKAGKRYNLNTKEFQILRGFYEVVYERNEFFDIETMKEVYDTQYYWETIEN